MSKTVLGLAIALVLALLVRPAHADESDRVSVDDRSASAPAPTSTKREPPRNALSLQLMSLLNHGVNLQYERQVLRRVSIATSVGGRWSGGDQYDVTETSFGGETRIWIVGRAPFSRWSEPAMVGPYVGFRFDVELTKVSGENDRLVGSSLRFGEAISLGARIVLADRFELTPAMGFGLREEVDPRGRLAPWTRPELRFGTTFGVVF